MDKRDKKGKSKKQSDSETAPDWVTPCTNCGAVPTVPATGMCGPCTFGESDTANGNW
jgi:hypothetical protein